MDPETLLDLKFAVKSRQIRMEPKRVNARIYEVSKAFLVQKLKLIEYLKGAVVLSKFEH